MSYFMRQNELINNGTLTGPGLHYLHMDTLGIINGCIDNLDETEAYIKFAWNNTYGIKAYTEEQYYHAMYELTREGGLKDQAKECRRLQLEADPENYGDLQRVNEYCQQASDHAGNVTNAPYFDNKKFGWFDITHPLADPFPAQVRSNIHWHG